MRRGYFVSLVACGWLFACSPIGGTTWLRAHAAGDRAYSAGRFDEATLAYAHAAEVAERPRDRDESLYAAAEASIRAGHVDDALKRFDALAAEKPIGDRSIRAAYRAAQIRLAHGQVDRAYRDLETIYKTAPDHGIARHALFAVIDRIDAQGGHAAAIAALAKLYAPNVNNRLGPEILYALAGREEAIGAAREALDHYLAIADRYPYPTGALWDDALWHASLLQESLGEIKAAVASLERMLSVHETSDGNGSYDRPRMPAAALRLAELQRDRLDDHKAARRSFARMRSTFPKSVLVARAAFAQAQLAHADGDDGEACDLARMLLSQHADTRWARRSDEACPAVAEQAGKLRAERHAHKGKREIKDAGKEKAAERESDADK